MDLNEFKLLSEINPENITKVHKINLVYKFMNIKAEQPNLTQEQICKKLGISSSTIKRIRQDLNVKSPYRYEVPLKKKQEKSKPDKKQETVLAATQSSNKSDKKKVKEKIGHGSNDCKIAEELIKEAFDE